MQAAEVMTRHIITTTPEATVEEAARLMLQNGISGLPVLDATGALVGIVTEGDLLRRAETGTQRRRPRWLEFLVGPGRLAAEYVHAHGRKVEEVMTRRVVSVELDTPLATVVTLMERHRVKRLPVVSGDRLVGIVSRANLLRALASIAPAAPAGRAGDAEIRKRIMAEIDKQRWAPRACVNVIVRHGVADLWGVIMDEREREALRVAAENTPGVVEVRDHLSWIEPVSGVVIAGPDERPDGEGADGR